MKRRGIVGHAAGAAPLVLVACAACGSRTPSVSAPGRAAPAQDRRCLAIREQAERQAASRVGGATASIPAGVYIMGSPPGVGDDDERPAHEVQVAAFSLDVTEVTVRDYRACVDAGQCTAPVPYEPLPGQRSTWCNWQHPEARDHHPINCVTQVQATAYCASVGKRLPTEEEWEYAARRGGGAYPWGDDAPTPERVNACGPDCVDSLDRKNFERFLPAPWGPDCFPESAPVGSFPAGASKDGVLDLAGNVSEWTSSQESDDYAKARHPGRVMQRGGSWYTAYAADLRAAYRLSDPPGDSFYFIGFRCAR